MTENVDDELDYNELTPGIRNMVRLLRDAGFDTTDSGDGVTNVQAGMECAWDTPMVAGMLDYGVDSVYTAGARLIHVLRGEGFDPEPGQVQITFDAADLSLMFHVVGFDDTALAEARERKARTP